MDPDAFRSQDPEDPDALRNLSQSDGPFLIGKYPSCHFFWRRKEVSPVPTGFANLLHRLELSFFLLNNKQE